MNGTSDKREGLRPGSLSKALAACLVAMSLLLVLLRSLQFGIETGGGARHLIDFSDLYAVGRMALHGAAGEAYDFAKLQAELLAETGREVFLPWAYPPAYDLIAAPLALLGPGAAYALFIGASLALYLVVMRALAGEGFARALLVAAPVIPVNIFTGQNGLLVAALAGLFALGWRGRNDRQSGLALGLLALKPHLAVGLGLLALAGGRWRSLGLAALTAAVLALAATLAFGPGIWAAFLAAARGSSIYLSEGRFPLWRMLSVYASLRTGLGLSATAALVGQGTVLVGVAGLASWAARRLPPAEAAGLMLVATLAVSPYSYDYDMALAGPAAALLLPAIVARSGPLLQVPMVAAIWFCSLLGWLIPLRGTFAGVEGAPEGLHYLAFGGPVLLILLAGLAMLLRRAPDRAANGGGLAPAAGAAPPGRAWPGRLVKALAALFIAAAVLLILLRMVQFLAEARHAVPVAFIDFDDFYVAGRMVLQGGAALAYDAAALQAEVLRQTGHAIFLPWAYPPPYDLLVGALALLPAATAYGLFLGLSLAAYLGVLQALAGPRFALAVLAVFPAIAVNVATGQNGLMTGALAGAFAFLCLRRRSGAGVPLGLLVLKPHLALGLGAFALAQGRWRAIAVAAAVAGGLCGLATMILGPDIWPAFVAGAGAASGYLAEGRFALSRMISAYAALRTLYGLDAGPALIGHAVGVMFALGATVWAARRLPAREGLGLALLTTLLISPYGYDYDLALAGPAVALLLPALEARTGPALRAGLLALLWVSCLPGLRPRPAGAVADGLAAGLAAGLSDPRYAAFAGQTLWILFLALVAILAWPTQAAETDGPGLAAAAE